MSKFLTINSDGDMINTDMIAFIRPTIKGSIIFTIDGEQLHSEFNLTKEIEDEAEVRAVIPCHGVGSLYYLGDGRTEIKPCPLVYLMSDGSLEPVVFADHYDIEECASEGGSSFVGFVPMP